jgi:hypothetical protein
VSARPVGYSGKALAAKLGLREGSHFFVSNCPAGYLESLEPLPLGLEFVDEVTELTDLVQVFCDRRSRLKAELEALRGSIRDDGVVWVSWPKKSSRIPSEVTEATIRELALPLGFVDVKVCAVSEAWSALKLVIRRELREG